MSEQKKLARVLEADSELLAQSESLLAQNAVRPGEGAALVRDVERFVSRFVVLPATALLPVALWTIGTHLFDAFETFPYLALLSPEKGCGKTRTTEVLEQVVDAPVRAVSVSEAALFRLIDSTMPTLILDEAEVLTGKGERAEAVRALLNAGNRTGAKVPRCVGSSHELRMFNVYSPKIVCAIRFCPETVRDRSIVVLMQRKRPGEPIERFILRRIKRPGEELRKRIEAWVEGNRAAIGRAYECLDVDFLSDRDLENFEPLLAILTVADASRFDQLRTVAEALTAGKLEAAEDESPSLRLLADVRAVWAEGEPKIFTVELLRRLRGVEDGPWASNDKFDARRLSRMLRPFGVAPATVQIGQESRKGYYREALEDVFACYLVSQPSGPSEPRGY